jgi:hypothetical protein
MNQFRTIAAVAIVGLIGAAPASAQGKSGTHGGGATTHGRPTTTTGGTTTHGKSADTTTRGRSADAPGKATAGEKSARNATTSSLTTSGTTTTTGPNALSTRLSSKPDQLARITPMLPAGMTLDQATAGFRNQGQFIAALNASKNQGVPFADLQKAMTVDGLSLGQAVRTLKAPAPSTTTGGTTTPPTTTPSTTSAS